MNVKLHASEPDADDQQDDNGPGEGTDDQTNDGAQDQDDAQDAQTDDQQDDDADDGTADDTDESQNADVDAQPRRGIAERARAARSQPEIDPVRLAGETAAATARTIAQENANATARAEAERQEREAMAGMDENQRATYLVAKETQQLRNSNAHTQVLLRSNSDQNAFGRVIARKPQYAKYEAEVEARHQQLLAGGGFATRQMILEQLIGEKALKAENVQNQKRDAKQRIQAQRGGNGGGRAVRGDAGGQNKQQRANLVSRMERDNPVI
jgi:hypothetical protein